MKKYIPETDEYRKNEYATNRLLAIFLLAFVIMGTVNEISFWIDGFEKSLRINSLFFFPVNISILVTVIVARVFRFSKPWIKDMLLLAMTLAVFVSFCYYTTYTLYIVTAPIFIASRYFDRKITLTVSLSSIVLFIFSCFLNTKLEKTSGLFQHLHSNATYNMWASSKDTFMFLIAPCTLLMFFVCFFAADMTGSGRKLLFEKVKNTEKISEIDAEIGMAAEIQKSALPGQEYKTPDGHLSLHAYETPAREVCGDFYDYFMLDDSRLCVIAADVSDKGLPAAMFMMGAKKTLKCCVSVCENPEEAISMANRMLCTDNEYGMFLTLWMGLIDTRTGVGKYVNAGHPFPVLRHGDGSAELLENEPDLFLGAFQDANPASHSFRLLPDDRLFIYTDGLCDAVNTAGESFGSERLLDCIRKDRDIIEEVTAFSRDAEQFDDITLLRLDCADIQKPICISKTVPATIPGTGEIQECVQAALREAGFADDVRRNAGICIDEICNNISEYSYTDGGEIGFSAEIGANYIEMTFSDRGPEFNILDYEVREREDPLQIGGLGISFVRQLSDSVSYIREDGQNRLTLLMIQ